MRAGKRGERFLLPGPCAALFCGRGAAMTEFLKPLPVVKVAIAACADVEPQKAELLWVPIAKLLIDTRYQRDMTQSGVAHVERIAEKFDWKKFTPLIVTPEGENFAVIDGQHRATAAKARGFTTCPAICMPFPSFRKIRVPTVRPVMAMSRSPSRSKSPTDTSPTYVPGSVTAGVKTPLPSLR